MPSSGRSAQYLSTITTSVDEDPVEPCGEAVGVAELVEPLPRDHQGVLHSVLGLVRIAEEQSGQPV